ncbi:MAG: hypothetical protein WC365_01120 [Candidatus Babeliales bacterium]|jgi:tRNA nucleotidyltransferase (CCA-adding enzyme)
MVNEYYVGGMVRDMLINRVHGTPISKHSDVDIAVEASSYEEMRAFVLEKGADIKVETPKFFTIRAIVDKVPIDYTLCRKEGIYKDGRHPESVEVGTIEEDLARRDLTINAIAMNPYDQSLVDPYNGLADIKNRTIRAVGDVETRCAEDYLRVLRILRFSITLGFTIAPDTETILYHPLYVENLFNTVSDERIREEFTKMFRHNTGKTLDALNEYPLIKRKMVKVLWLRPTF